MPAQFYVSTSVPPEGAARGELGTSAACQLHLLVRPHFRDVNRSFHIWRSFAASDGAAQAELRAIRPVSCICGLDSTAAGVLSLLTIHLGVDTLQFSIVHRSPVRDPPESQKSRYGYRSNNQIPILHLYFKLHLPTTLPL